MAIYYFFIPMQELLLREGCEYLGTFNDETRENEAESLLNLYKHDFFWVQEETNSTVSYLLFNYYLDLEKLRKSTHFPFGLTITIQDVVQLIQRGVNQALEAVDHSILEMSTDEGEDCVHANLISDNCISLEFDVDLTSGLESASLNAFLTYIKTNLIPYALPITEIENNQVLLHNGFSNSLGYLRAAAFTNYQSGRYVSFLNKNLFRFTELKAA